MSQQAPQMIAKVKVLLAVFAGQRPLGDIATVMDENVVHKNYLLDRQGQALFGPVKGIQEWKTWAIILRRSVANLGVAIDDLIVKGDKVLAIFRWTADSWHPAIKGDPKYSNYVVARFTVKNDKIVMTETERSNYLFMFGPNFEVPQLQQQYREILGFKAKTAELKSQPHTSQNTPKQTQRNGKVAIVGMAGILPGADNLDTFWHNLEHNIEVIARFEQKRWPLNHPQDQEKGPVGRYAALVDSFDKFDPMFFALSAKEAELMDPQQRLCLLTAWQAIEQAGIAPSAFANARSAVFVACCSEDHKQLYQQSTMPVESLNYTGLESSMLAHRLARLLDCAGPVQTLNAECATTLIAIDHARNLIGQNKIDSAIVSAVNILLHPFGYLTREHNGLLSQSGEPKPFAKDSSGYVRGEGAISFVLKDLALAEQDNDQILGVIVASNSNQSQNTLSLTAPNVASQTQVLQQAWQQAGIDPSTIDYIETHANGYPEGDLVEISVLKNAFGTTSLNQKRCALGSVKSSIGHLEAASGGSMLARVLLAMQKDKLLPIKGLTELHPAINLNGTPLYVLEQAQPWPKHNRAKRAGINSFGVGGINAHIVVESYEALEVEPAYTGPQLIVLSAKTAAALKQKAKDLAQFVEQQSPRLGNVAYTLQTGREAMAYRLALVVSDTAELIQKLHAYANEAESHQGIFSGKVVKGKSDICAIDLAKTQSVDYLQSLGHEWVQGAQFNWSVLYQLGLPRKIALPGYPFNLKAYWPLALRPREVKVAAPDSIQPQETQQMEIQPQSLPAEHQPKGAVDNKAVEFYSHWANSSDEHFADYQEEYLTFCPFDERIAGFSLTRVFLNPGQYPQEMAYVQQRQIEMREVLFYEEDYANMAAMFDFGCGHGTDVIQFAKRHPHLKTQGYTITKAQAELGNKRIAQNQLSGRAEIFNRDSAKDPFPRLYDLIIGVEVSFHIRDKDGLFGNIARSLKPGGRVLLMDFIANLRGAIADPNVEITIPTDREWLDLLARFKLKIDKLIDVSKEVANFLYDPDFTANIATQPKVVKDTYQNYVHQSLALDNGWISYSLFKLEKDESLSYEQLVAHNREKIANQTPYAYALAQMKGLPLPDLSELMQANKAKTPVVEMALSNTQDIRQTLIEIFAKVLKFDASDIAAADSFNTLGVTSITAIDLLQNINGAFDLHLPTSLVFEYNDMDALVAAITQEINAKPTPQKIMGSDINIKGSDTKLEGGAPVNPNDIAVIGMSARCAGASDITEFWQLICEGKDAIGEIEDPQWLEVFAQSAKPVPTRFGKMAEQDCFDPLFFNISPKEAASIDSAQRILLEQSYKALEDAAIAPKSLKGQKAGCYIGSMGARAGQQNSHFNMLGFDTSILAARLPYFLDFKGPALAVNTACSSSLVAIDLACNALKDQQINIALAGGITLYQDPGLFIEMNNAQMLSPSAQCRPFDHQADGIIVGDGVGVVVLKRLSDAMLDNNQIYGVIKGSGTNQDGQTTGITVPSFVAQSELCKQIYQDNHIDVEDIQYIETHGTATKLGDPIEIHALTRSFSAFSDKKGYCALGALKANIGHTTAAAGVLGLIKVLLCLKQQKLPPSIHFDKANEHIDFATSPFYVNTELKPWPVGTEHNHGKRLAALSSFGFSGTNAHLVVEEFMAKAPVLPSGPVAIVLSAKTEQCLKAQAEQLLAFVKQHKPNLYSLAYTLQLGRDAMEYRLAFVAEHLVEVIQQLGAFVAAKPSAELHLGDIDSGKSDVGSFNQDPDFVLILNAWLGKGQFDKLLPLWVKGVSLNWTLCYGANPPPPISAPSYAFAKERLVAPSAASTTTRQAVSQIKTVPLHPLLNRNTSNFERLQFSAGLSARHPLVKDHIVLGQCVVPGVALLEMARFGFAQLSAAQGFRPVTFSDITWLKAIVLDGQTRQIDMGFSKAQAQPDEVIFEVAGHCKGRITALNDTAQSVDIASLQARFSTKDAIEQSAFYQQLAAQGLGYGEDYRQVQQLWFNGAEALARIECMQCFDEPLALAPALFDCALQLQGLFNQNGQLPFALDKLAIFKPLKGHLWAYATKQAKVNGGAKIDLLVMDEEGELCLKAEGLTCRDKTKPKPQDSAELIQAAPVWQVQSERFIEPSALDKQTLLIAEPEQVKRLGALAQRCSILDTQLSNNQKTLEQHLAQLPHLSELTQVIWLAPQSTGAVDSAMIAAAEIGVKGLFRLVKALVNTKMQANALQLTVITQKTVAIHQSSQVDATHSAVHGLVGSLAKEYPHWQVRCCDITELNLKSLMACLSQDFDKNGQVRAYRHEQWFERTLAPLPFAKPTTSLFKNNGVYVVLGGAGGIGAKWSKWLAEQFNAQLIWLGRRTLNQAIDTLRNDIATVGPKPCYIEADATDFKALKAAFEQIKTQFGKVNGVVHSAIHLADKSLGAMDEATFERALKAKLDTSVNLAMVTAQLLEPQSLDFALFLSSLQSFMTLPGQSNYASACTFKDAFALQLNSSWPCAVKVMNWGYWGQVGVVAQDKYRDKMRQAGIGSIEPQEGIAAISRLLELPLNQMALVKTLKPGAIKEISQTVQLAYHLSTEQNPQSSLLAQTQVALPAKQLNDLRALKQQKQHGFERLLPELFSAILADFDGAEVLPKYQRWLASSKGFTSDGSHNDVSALWLQWHSEKMHWPNQNEVALVEPCLQQLVAIITGKTQATDVIFAKGSDHLVSQVYANNPLADSYNQLLAMQLCNQIKLWLSHQPNRQIRLLEVGAGTGSTSKVVLEALQPFADNIAQYHFSDISKAFLLNFERYIKANDDKANSANLSFVTTGLLNIEQEVTAQGLSLDSFDIVLGTQVFHACSDIRASLNNAKALLHQNGVLLLNEMSQNSLFHHLTFGLLDGWWRYQDAPLRMPGCPGIAASSWLEILNQQGFDAVHFVAPELNDLGQQIIAAKSDGLVLSVTDSHLAPKVAPKAQDEAPLYQTLTATNSHGVSSANPVNIGGDFKRKVSDWVKRQVGETLGMQPSQLNGAKPMEVYGMDSILVVQLTEQMRKFFDPIDSTLFFQVQTINALVAYLMEKHQLTLLELTGHQSSAAPAVVAEPVATQSLAVLNPSQHELSQHELSQSQPLSATQDIAIIGLSGRYPQAEDINAFWRLLKEGVNAIGEIPPQRWSWQAHFDSEKGKAGHHYSRYGGFVADIDLFDPLFFSISPRDAEAMDPQQRLFLEQAYWCLEDAGYTAKNLATERSVGVFVGVMNSGYNFHPSYSSIANRVSYLFDFQGPSIAVDTACSSSLTAIHLAIESIKAGSCEVAIAGGVNLIIHPEHYIGLSELTMLSSGDKCKAFGAGADGFVDGEGVGAVLLKPLDKAVLAHDHIYGVVKASQLNSAGKTNGFTVPNPNAQGALIAKAIAKSGVPVEAIGYIEAHGTGTVLGDPIEVAGLSLGFSEASKQALARQFCALGSVKSNIGHLESAAGIAGLSKVLLQLKAKQLAPSLHAKQLNPNIDFATTPFYVQQHLSDWPKPSSHPRTAGLSSFGAGGANAHVIVSEYDVPREALPQAERLILLSANTTEQLKKVAQNLYGFVMQNEADLADIAYTLQVGREAKAERLALKVESLDALKSKLKALLDSKLNVDADIQGYYRSKAQQNDLLSELFAEDEALESAVASWVLHQRFDNLLKLWVNGYEFNWHRLYGEKRPYRISLPVYPFARKSYWAPSKALAGQRINPAAEQPRNPLNWLFTTEQRLSAPLEPAIDLNQQLQALNGLRICCLSASSTATLVKQMAAVAGVDFDISEYADLSEQMPFTEQNAPDVVFACFDNMPRYFELSKALLKAAWQKPIRIYASFDKTNLALIALSGFARAAMSENPNHSWHLVGLDDTSTQAQKLCFEWLAGTPHHHFTQQFYQQHNRTQAQLSELELNSLELNSPQLFKAKGSYVLAGGFGPLGVRLCRKLAEQTQATLVVLGRSAPDLALIAELQRLGSKVHYYQVDIADKAALSEALSQARNAAGPFDGVVHLARLVEDGLIVDKSWPRFEQVVAAKVLGSKNLDELTGQDPLSLFLLFSSMAAYRISGSADYGYACAYQNAYAEYRAALVQKGERSGQSVSLCFGPWTEDKYQPQGREQNLSAQGFDFIDIDSLWPQLQSLAACAQPVVGIMAVTDANKVKALLGLHTQEQHQEQAQEHLDDSLKAQVKAAIEQWERRADNGESIGVEEVTQLVSFAQIQQLDDRAIQRLYRLMFPADEGAEAADTTAKAQEPAQLSTQSSLDTHTQAIAEAFCAILKLDEIDHERSFQDYGLDSIAAMQVSLRLEKALAQVVNPADLMEYTCVRSLSEHLKQLAAQ